MLLLLISLFSNYVLIHCNQVGQANFNKTQLSAQMHRSIRQIDTLLRDFQQEIQKQKSVLRTVDLESNLKDVGLLDYSTILMWWEGIPGINQTGGNTPVTTFLPTPVEQGTTDSNQDLWKTLDLFPGVKRSIYVPTDPVYYDILQATLNTTTIKTLSTVSKTTTATSISFTPSTTPTTSSVSESDREYFDEDYVVNSSATLIGLLRPIRPTRPPNDADIPTIMATVTRPSKTTTRVSTLSSSPPLSLPILRGQFTSNPKTSTMFNFFTIAKLMKERTDYTPIKRTTKANRITQMTHRPRQIRPTLSKAQAWVRNRQWTKTSKAGTTSGGRTNEGKTKIGTTKEGLRTTVPQLFQENTEGLLVASFPANISEYVTSPQPVAGDVLHFARNFTRPSTTVVRPNQVYHDLMDEWDEGYMMVFLLQISRLVFLKKKSDVRHVLIHAELIMNRFDETAEFAWLGRRINKMAMDICRFCSGESIYNMDIVQSYAGMFNKMLKERDTAVSAEMNSIIDSADLMYDDREGEALFNAVREFEEYPNVTKNGREICLNLMQTFMSPYRRLRTTQRGQRLLDSVNRAIITRFGNRRANGELLMLDGKGKATTKPNHSIERKHKRVHNSLKRRIDANINRHLINRTKHHDSNEDTYRRQLIQAAEYPMLRKMLPITRHQKRFRVITPRQLRSNAYLNNERPTKDYFYRRHDRPIHLPNGMLQIFSQATKESENKRRMQPTEVTQRLKESVSQKKPGRMKAELIRRIVEDTSYSDEEAVLKLNLRVIA